MKSSDSRKLALQGETHGSWNSISSRSTILQIRKPRLVAAMGDPRPGYRSQDFCVSLSAVFPSPGLNFICYSHAPWNHVSKILDWLSLGATLSLLLLCLPSLSSRRNIRSSLHRVHGARPVVILCGHEAVKEALVDKADEFSGRGELASIERNFQGHGR